MSKAKLKNKVYVLKKALVIPKGTELYEWQGAYEAVIGLNKDSVAYLRTFDVETATEYLKVKE